MKPEYWTDEKAVGVSIPARLLFLGILNFADDAGNIEYSPPQIKMRVLPADTIDVVPLLGELVEVGLLREYYVSDKKYLSIPNFKKHQVINKPSKSRVPPPPTTVVLPDGSGSGSGSGREEETTNPPVTDGEYIAHVKEFYNGLEEKVGTAYADWQKHYGDVVNVDSALFAATTWLIENPRHRKKNLKKFYGNWLRNQFTRATQPMGKRG